MRQPDGGRGQVERFGEADEAAEFGRLADPGLLADDLIGQIGLADFDEGGGNQDIGTTIERGPIGRDELPARFALALHAERLTRQLAIEAFAILGSGA